ncbi:MAG TPA: LON peptidase substrate-binding domain-containing protein [Pyrinomonadaceae bacterium]|nr:LON peptidase substrate-binding domain-containing protein [Pyrinomonadaceae bacterium]
MSEALERIRGIRQLPLFPLPVVLLPNELLPLHIFEPRYRQMLKDVQLTNRIFGVSYIRGGESRIAAAAETPEIGSLGCATEVRNVEMLEDGRSNIATVGLMRYRLDGYVETGEPYLIGEITFFEDDAEEQAVLQSLADEVFALFMRVAKAAHDLSGERGRMPEIPQVEPQHLSFLIAAAFNLQPEEKYEFLEMRSTAERLRRLREMLRQTVGKVEESASMSKIAKTNGHGNKPIRLD